MSPSPWTPPLPPGRTVDLGRRGKTFIRELAGPPGAPTVVLLHGWTVNADLNWFWTYERLGRSFRVIAIDHRGHGQGIRTRKRFRLADCADDVAAVCEQLGIERYIPVGYSMGGPIAMLTWHRHRERVAGLVLCATSPYFAGNRQQRAFFSVLPVAATAARLTPKAMRRNLGQQLLTGRIDDSALGAWASEQIRQGNPGMILEAGAAIGRFDARPWLAEIDVPTVVVRTMQDPVVPPHRQTLLATKIPGAEAVDIDAMHGACVTDPRRFVPALQAAVDRVADRGSSS